MDTKIHNNHQHSSGKLSLILSTICLIHCIATPILLMSFPLLSFYLRSFHTAEWILLGVSCVLGVMSIKHGMDNHYTQKSPLLLFISGMSIAIFSHLLLGESIAANILLVIGGLLAAFAQFLNLRLSRPAVNNF